MAFCLCVNLLGFCFHWKDWVCFVHNTHTHTTTYIFHISVFCYFDCQFILYSFEWSIYSKSVVLIVTHLSLLLLFYFIKTVGSIVPACDDPTSRGTTATSADTTAAHSQPSAAPSSAPAAESTHVTPGNACLYRLYLFFLRSWVCFFSNLICHHHLCSSKFKRSSRLSKSSSTCSCCSRRTLGSWAKR